jgi:hypothetical protein
MLMQHWPLAIATMLITAVAMQLVWHSLARSASGQLRRALGERQEQATLAGKARATTGKVEARLDAMLKKSAKVKPRALQECKEALQDARALQKIAEDKLLIAENHVRRVIHEEFPPVKQQKLRARFLPEAAPDRRPFSF